jgi:hypothetical protein
MSGQKDNDKEISDEKRGTKKEDVIPLDDKSIIGESSEGYRVCRY